MIVQLLHGGVAKSAARDIDDALEGEIVGRLVDDSEVSQRIADFCWSASTSATRAPRPASAEASVIAVIVLPQPPLRLATRIVCIAASPP